MEERKQTKAERREAGQPSKAERKQAKLRRKARARSAAEPVDALGPAGESSADGIELRLARLEAAVTSQAELSEQLLLKLDEVLHTARKSARQTKTAATPPDEEDPAAGEGV